MNEKADDLASRGSANELEALMMKELKRRFAMVAMGTTAGPLKVLMVLIPSQDNVPLAELPTGLAYWGTMSIEIVWVRKKLKPLHFYSVNALLSMLTRQ